MKPKTKKKTTTKKKTKPRKKIVVKKKPITGRKVKKKDTKKEDMKIRFSTTINVTFSYNKHDFPIELREDLIDSLIKKINDLSISRGGVSLVITSAKLV